MPQSECQSHLISETTLWELKGKATPQIPRRVLYHVSNLVVPSLDPTSGRDRILDQVSFTLTEEDLGNVVLLLGPKGCGKSSLLRWMAFNQGLQGRVDRLSYTCDSVSSSGNIGHLPPTNELLSPLTVSEFLLARAMLSAPPGEGPDSCRARVYAILEELSIAHLAGMRIGHGMEDKGGLSGGERRRVAIAGELLVSPKLLLLDEPTSGLDSMTSLKLMRLVSHIAKTRQICVVLSMHHPSSILFKAGEVTKIMAMQEGRLEDPSVSVDSDCEKIIEVVYARTLEHFVHLNTSPDRAEADLPPSNATETQTVLSKLQPIGFVPFAKRHLLLRWRMTNTPWVWGSRLFVGVLASMCFWDTMNLTSTYNYFDHKGLLFMLLMHFQYETLYMTQANMFEERRCYHYEIRRGYISPFTLTVGRIPGEISMNALNAFPLCLFLMLAGNAYSDLTSIDLGVKFCFYFTFLLAMSSMWKAVGMWIRDYRRMTWIGDLYVNTQMQVAGFWTAISYINSSGLWLRYISVITQAFNGLVITMAKDRIYTEVGPDGSESTVTGSELTQRDGLTLPIWLNFVIMFYLWFVFELIAWSGAMYGRVFRH